MREPFEVPDKVVIDENTGLAMNIPASMQEWPNWWNEDKERYAALLEARKRAGIIIDDFPRGTERIVGDKKWIPMGR